MIAVIPAAGMATRLRPLTLHRPKCLLEVAGKSLIGRAMDALRANGIRRVAIVTGYLGRMIRDYVERAYPDIEVVWIENERYESTNNIFSLRLAVPVALQDPEGVLLLDSDILFDPEAIGRLLADPRPDVLALEPHQLGEEEIKVCLDNEGLVREISKSCPMAEAAGESVGIEKMSARYFRALAAELEQMCDRKGLDNVFYEKAFERLIPQGFRFAVADISDLFAMELDTPADFEEASRLLPAHLR